MDNSGESKPSTSKSDLIVISPKELMKLGIFKSLQHTVAKVPSNDNHSSVNLKQKIRSRIKEVVQTTDQNNPVCSIPKSCDTEKHTEISNRDDVKKNHSCSTSTSNIDKNIDSEPLGKLIKKEKRKCETKLIIDQEEPTNKSKLIKKSKKHVNLRKTNKNPVKDIVNKKHVKKKKLKIISDMAVNFSSEELKHLMSSAKLKNVNPESENVAQKIDKIEERGTDSEPTTSKLTGRSKKKLKKKKTKKKEEKAPNLKEELSMSKEMIFDTVKKDTDTKKTTKNTFINLPQPPKKLAQRLKECRKKIIFDVLKKENEIRKAKENMSINLTINSSQMAQREEKNFQSNVKRPENVNKIFEDKEEINRDKEDDNKKLLTATTPKKRRRSRFLILDSIPPPKISTEKDDSEKEVVENKEEVTNTKKQRALEQHSYEFDNIKSSVSKNLLKKEEKLKKNKKIKSKYSINEDMNKEIEAYKDRTEEKLEDNEDLRSNMAEVNYNEESEEESLTTEKLATSILRHKMKTLRKSRDMKEPRKLKLSYKKARKGKDLDIEDAQPKDEDPVIPNKPTSNTVSKENTESKQKMRSEEIEEIFKNDSKTDDFTTEHKSEEPTESSVSITENKKGRRKSDIEKMRQKDETTSPSEAMTKPCSKEEDEEIMHENIQKKGDDAPNEDEDNSTRYKNMYQTEPSGTPAKKREERKKNINKGETEPNDETRLPPNKVVTNFDDKVEADIEDKLKEEHTRSIATDKAKIDQPEQTKKEETEQKEVPTKEVSTKKRGRRKKNADIEEMKPVGEFRTQNGAVANFDDKIVEPSEKVIEEIEEIKEKINEEKVVKNSTNAAAPKKRGRKKKTANIEEIKSVDELQTQNGISVKPDDKVDDDQMMNTTVEEIVQISTNTAAPSKRGRRKKNTNIEEIKEKDQFETSNNIVGNPEDQAKVLDQSEKGISEEIVQKCDTVNEDRSSQMRPTLDASIEDKSYQVVKRKRGRPRLNKVPEGTQVDPTLNEDTGTSTAAKRSKTKKEDAFTEDKPNEVTKPLDTSVNGRKRKKVNYFEMENDTNVEDDSGRKRKYRVIVPTAKMTKKNKAVLMSLESEDAPDLEVVDEEIPLDKDMPSTSQIVEENIEENEDTPTTSQIVEENQEEVVEDENSDEKQVTTDEKIDEKIELEKSSKRKKGGTITMINNVFSAAFMQKSTGWEMEDDSTGVPAELPASAHIDSRTRLARTIGIVIDKDNMVRCMQCNRKVNNDEWQEHNRYEHYNLAWREGEMEVNINNPQLLLKILRPILKENRYLECANCKKRCASVGGYITHREICTGIVSMTGEVTCAVCNEVMEKNQWSFHKQKKHNNLAWRVGDRPLNLKDKNLVMSILNALYKARKPLHCDRCGVLKKSVIGFLSHQAQCGTEITEVKVKCELCNRKVLPVSMQSHIKLVHETPKQTDVLGDSHYFDINTDSLPRRKAAQTAMEIIDKISGNRFVQEHHKYYIAQADFEEGFMMLDLQKELANNNTVRCRFKDCEFETDSVKILTCHMNGCVKKPEQYYVCKKCLLIFESELEIKTHIKDVHRIKVIDDDYDGAQAAEHIDSDDDDNIDDEDDEQQNLKKRLTKDGEVSDVPTKVKPNFLYQLSKRPMRLFCRAFKYTVEFCEANYSIPLLFNELRNIKSDWILLDEELTEAYLPQAEESCSVAKTMVSGTNNVLAYEYTFKKFELFESVCEEGIATMFCGGPVYALAWLPTPYTISDSKQVLAVAVGKDFDKNYLIGENYNDSSVIQFWDFDILRNKGKMSPARLMFCLAFDFGPVWHIEWCPSGCYDNQGAQKDGASAQRMGLMAVAGSNSFVYVYSVPFLEEEAMGLIYRVKPVLKLQLMIRDEVVEKRDRFFATKIAWSTASGHRYVAVGYTDGMVGLFDLGTDSKLLRFKDKGVDVLLPYRKFQAHLHYISALSWIPLSGGNRWLMTASFDRDIFIWDLTNGSKASHSQKQVVTDGQWLSNWMSFVTSADESSTNFHAVRLCIQSYRDYLYDHVFLMVSPSTVTSLSTSNWLNSVIQSSAQGEITVTFSNQLLYGLNTEKNLKRLRHHLGYIKLIDRHKTPEERVAEEKLIIESNQKAIKDKVNKHLSTSHLLSVENSRYSKYEPNSYKEAVEKYGLLFCDIKMDMFNDLQKTVKYQDLSFSRPNLYSMQKINKVAYNPNRQASLYYATGHEVGFVRVQYLQVFENDLQIV